MDGGRQYGGWRGVMLSCRMEHTLDETLRAARDGDAEAWRRLVDAYSGRVYGLLYRQCGDGDLAEEITQATFVRLVTRLSDYQEQGRFESWLFRVAMNQLRDELRRKKRQAKAMDFEATPPEHLSGRRDGPTPFDRLETQEQHAMLRAMVERMNEADREILHLRYTADLTFAQIAETLDQPLGTVLARGHRALKKLKQMLSEAEAEVD